MSPRATIIELFALLLVWAGILSLVPGCGLLGQFGTHVPGSANPAIPGNTTAENVPAGSLEQFARPAETVTAPDANQPAPDALLLTGGGAFGGAPVPEKQSQPQAPRKTAGSRAARPARVVDGRSVEAAGLRRLQGNHLDLYTDLPVDEEIAALPEIFDQAFPQWCEYLGVDPAQHANWQMRGCLIGDIKKFAGTGLIPENLPPFRNGYARDGELWLYEQPSDYYRRHLLLHEGTHGFMDSLLGGSGPPWFMEGMAELLATHTWRDGRLTLNVMPDSKDHFPMLGRIKIVNDATRKAGRPQSLQSVLNYSHRAHLENEPYGWCWAAAAFLDRHPRYQERFRKLKAHVQDPSFNQYFAELYADDRAQLEQEWELFAGTLEHGHHIAATAIEFSPSVVLGQGGREVTIDAARGWQSTGLALQAGRKYKLSAQGRYQIAKSDQPWLSEPGGVTIRYYRSQPLGMLLGAIVPEAKPGAARLPAGGLLAPFPVGLELEFSPEVSGTLYLQANDSAGERGDNDGQAIVSISAL